MIEIITTSRIHGGRDEEEIVLPYEDIAEAIPSSFDSRFPVKSIFKANTSSSSSTVSHTASPLALSHGHLIHQPSLKNGFRSRGSSWMSTGLVPQFIVITFFEKWMIRKIEVKTISVDRLAVHVNYSASTAFSSTRLVDMKRDIVDGYPFSSYI